MNIDVYRQVVEGLLDILKSTISSYVSESERLVNEADKFTKKGNYEESAKRLYAANVIASLTSKVNSDVKDRVIDLLGEDTK